MESQFGIDKWGMANIMADDKSAAQDVQEHFSRTVLVRKLIEWRTAKALTQRQLAARMGVSASKVCRMEAAQDADLNWGDIVRYFDELGVRLSLLTDDPNLPAAERIKHHVFAIHGLLEELQVLAQEMGAGDDITEKISKFYGDVLFNFVIRFADCYSKLPQTGPTQVSSGIAEEASSEDKRDDASVCAH